MALRSFLAAGDKSGGANLPVYFIVPEKRLG
jgi:hypothetical protein